MDKFYSILENKNLFVLLIGLGQKQINIVIRKA